MLGYYKNPEATEAAIDKDGWFHTGDLGLMDGDGNVFIKGRSKNLLLGSNGQNIYPEEIEDKLNSLPLVNECLVIQEGNKLVGLVHPDFDEAKSIGLGNEDIEKIMEQDREQLNTLVPHTVRSLRYVSKKRSSRKPLREASNVISIQNKYYFEQYIGYNKRAGFSSRPFV